MIARLTYAAALLGVFCVAATAAPKQACNPRAVCLEKMGIPAHCKSGIARFPRVTDRVNQAVNSCIDQMKR